LYGAGINLQLIALWSWNQLTVNRFVERNQLIVNGFVEL
jgi:hypothetical protein